MKADMKKVNTANGYDFYVGKDKEKNIWYYNIVPQGSPSPAGGYYSKHHIASIKKVSAVLFNE
jgi:hypothetical protein